MVTGGLEYNTIQICTSSQIFMIRSFLIELLYITVYVNHLAELGLFESYVNCFDLLSSHRASKSLSCMLLYLQRLCSFLTPFFSILHTHSPEGNSPYHGVGISELCRAQPAYHLILKPSRWVGSEARNGTEPNRHLIFISPFNTSSRFLTLL